MFSLLMTGIRRRKKEIIPIVLVTLIITFFMSGILMVQSILNAYIKEQNRENYGDWIISAEDETLTHPYLTDKGFLKTGPYIYDEAGVSYGLRIGYVDESLTSFARIKLYEGRLPENETEIASDLKTLQDMGYSYDLGQQITIAYNAAEGTQEQDMRTKTYTLVGTVKPFSSMWMGSFKYPRLLVSEKEMDTYPLNATIWFYRFDPKLKDVDGAEFFGAFKEGKEGLTFNSYVYSSILWDSRDFYRIVSYMMITVAVFAVTWLLSSYVDRRLKEYYRFRTMGASRRKLNGLIFLECAAACVPAAVIGIAASYAISAAVCTAIAKSVRLEGFFAFEWPIFLIQLAAVFGSILVSIFLVFLRTGDKRLTAGTRPVREKDTKILKKRFSVLKSPEKELLLRRSAIRRGPRILFTIFTLMVMAFLVICFLQLKTAFTVLKDVNRTEDFKIKATERRELRFYDVPMTVDWFMPFYGMTAEDVEELEQIYGVRSVDTATVNQALRLNWDGIENSRYAETGEGIYLDMYDGTGIGVPASSYPDEKIPEKVAAVYGIKLSRQQRYDFAEGKAAILMRPGGIIEQNKEHPEGIRVKYEDTTLKTGDFIRLYWWDQPEKTIELPVIVVDQSGDIYDEMKIVSDNEWIYEHTTGEFHVFMADSVSEQLRQFRGEDNYKWNRLEIWASQFSSFEATDKVLASYANKWKYTYENHLEYKRYMLHSNVVQPLLIYGCFFIMTLLVYIIIQHNYTLLFGRQMKDEVRLMKQVGMTDKAMNQMVFRHKIREYLPVIIGLAPGLLLTYFREYYFIKTVMAENHELAMALRIMPGVVTDNPWLAALDLTVTCGIHWLVLMLVIIFILMVIAASRVHKKSIRERQDESIRLRKTA